MFSLLPNEILHLIFTFLTPNLLDRHSVDFPTLFFPFFLINTTSDFSLFESSKKSEKSNFVSNFYFPQNEFLRESKSMVSSWNQKHFWTYRQDDILKASSSSSSGSEKKGLLSNNSDLLSISLVSRRWFAILTRTRQILRFSTSFSMFPHQEQEEEQVEQQEEADRFRRAMEIEQDRQNAFRRVGDYISYMEPKYNYRDYFSHAQQQQQQQLNNNERRNMETKYSISIGLRSIATLPSTDDDESSVVLDSTELSSTTNPTTVAATTPISIKMQESRELAAFKTRLNDFHVLRNLYTSFATSLILSSFYDPNKHQRIYSDEQEDNNQLEQQPFVFSPLLFPLFSSLSVTGDLGFLKLDSQFWNQYLDEDDEEESESNNNENQIQSACKLSELEISNSNKIVDSFWLFRLTQKLYSLHSLRISSCPLVLSPKLYSHSLTALNFTDIALSSEWFNHLTEMVPALQSLVLRSCKGLVNMCFHESTFVNLKFLTHLVVIGTDELSRPVVHSHSLVVLHLCECPQLTSFEIVCPNLQVLRLDSNSNLSDDDALASALLVISTHPQQQQQPKLQVLSINSSQFSRIDNAPSSLRILQVQNTHLNDFSLEQVLENISSLRLLDISNNKSIVRPDLSKSSVRRFWNSIELLRMRRCDNLMDEWISSTFGDLDSSSSTSSSTTGVGILKGPKLREINCSGCENVVFADFSRIGPNLCILKIAMCRKLRFVKVFSKQTCSIECSNPSDIIIDSVEQ